MFYIKLVSPSAVPNKKLPFVKNGSKVSLQLLYFCQAMKSLKVPGAILVSFLLFANAQTTSAQDTWSLQRSVDYALANNIQIKQADVQKRLAELTLKQYQMSMLPSLSGTINGQGNFGRSVNQATYTFENNTFFNSQAYLNGGIDLFNWFSKQNAIAAAKYDTKSQSFLQQKARNDLSFNIATAFLKIILNKEQVNITKVSLQQTTANLDNTKKLVMAGSVPESNQADLEAQQALDSSNLIAAENAVVISTLEMKALLNLGFDVPYVPEIPANIAALPLPRLDEVDPEMVFSAAMSINPLMKSYEMRIHGAEKNVASMRGQLFPTLRATYGLTTNYANNITQTNFNNPSGPFVTPIGTVNVNGTEYPVVRSDYKYGTLKTPFGEQISNQFGQSVGLTLSIPILNAWQGRTNLNKAKVNAVDVTLARDLDRQKLRQDIYTAHANAVSSIQKFQASSRRVEAAQKAYDFATKRFNIGLMNTIDYITTQSNLYKAQIDKVSAQYDYIFKMKLLEFYRDQKITL
ncbi:transporter [Chitinophaga sp. MD30]|nr:transporter [Chitinophaga sp. MD30]